MPGGLLRVTAAGATVLVASPELFPSATFLFRKAMRAVGAGEGGGGTTDGCGQLPVR